MIHLLHESLSALCRHILFLFLYKQTTFMLMTTCITVSEIKTVSCNKIDIKKRVPTKIQKMITWKTRNWKIYIYLWVLFFFSGTMTINKNLPTPPDLYVVLVTPLSCCFHILDLVWSPVLSFMRHSKSYQCELRCYLSSRSLALSVSKKNRGKKHYVISSDFRDWEGEQKEAYPVSSRINTVPIQQQLVVLFSHSDFRHYREQHRSPVW